MPHNVETVANTFLEIASENNKSLTNMQLQKLVFLAQGYSLALLDKSLFEKNVHAWQWGPVIPTLYKKLQKFGSGYVYDKLPPGESLPVGPERQIIEGVWDAYGSHTGAQLSALTHRDGTPWSKTWERKHFDIIDPSDIKIYYQKLAN